MSNEVQFEDEKPYQTTNLNTNHMVKNHEAKMVSWIIKSGLAKTSKQANIILVGVAIVGLIISITLIAFNLNKKDLSKDPKYQLPAGLIKNQ